MSNYDLKETEFFNVLEQYGVHVSSEQKRRIQEKMSAVLNYEPKVGIFSKTGVGKSSLCNALFGQEVCLVSDISACTSNIQEVMLNIGGSGLKLIDMPGVGESREKDGEYAELYADLLPELDLILWLLKADDRAYTSDQIFYQNIVKPHIDEGKPFLFVLNQCDKIEPFREWNEEKHLPSLTQFANIYLKIKAVSEYFDVTPSKIIPISAKEKYNLSSLVDEIVYALPKEKKISFFNAILPENRSVNSSQIVKKSWYEIVGDFLISIVESGKDIVLKALDKAMVFAESFFDRFLNWF
jgi:small GTP-binding protein